MHFSEYELLDKSEDSDLSDDDHDQDDEGEQQVVQTENQAAEFGNQ